MKKYELIKKALESANHECILGSEDTGSHACYMIYGVLKPGEKERLIKPGKGHEEIILAVKGNLEVTGHYTGILEEGCAIHLAGDESCFLENKSPAEAAYVIAGGHSEPGHH